MSDAPRKVPPETFWRVARTTLGRMACVYADPARDGHRHDDCLVDDEAYAADLMLGMLGAAAAADEDAVLDRLTDIIDALGAST